MRILLHLKASGLSFIPSRMVFKHNPGETSYFDHTAAQTLEELSKKEQKRLQKENPEAVKKHFERLRKKAEEKMKDAEGLTEQEREEILKEADQQLERELVHQEVREFVTLKGKQLNTWVESIAKKYSTTVEQIAEDNPGVVKKVEGKLIGKGGFEKKHEGLHYVLKGAELKIRVPQRQAKQRILEQKVGDLIGESGAKTLETARKERAQHREEIERAKAETLEQQKQVFREGVLGNYNTLIRGKTVALPTFLKGNQTPEQWAQSLHRAGQTEGAQQKRLFDLLDDAPLAWNTQDLHKAINTGSNATLSFGDIVKTELGESEGKFLKRYEALDGEISQAEGAVKEGLIAEKQRCEDVMIQAFQILEAMAEMTEGEAVRGMTEIERYEAAWQLEEISTFSMGKPYDLDSIRAGKGLAADEGQEAIGLNKDIIQAVIVRLHVLGVDPKLTSKIDDRFILEFFVQTYGTEYLVEKGHLKKAKNTNSLYLESIPEEFNASNEALNKLLKTLELSGGSLKFDQNAANEMRLAVLIKHHPEAYARELARLSFETQKGIQRISLERLQRGEALVYSKTDYLSRLKQAEGALAEIMSSREVRKLNPETGKREIDWSVLINQINHYLSIGIERYFEDPNMDILEELEVAGIEVTPEDRAAIEKLNRQIDQKSKKAASLEKEQRGVWEKVQKENPVSPEGIKLSQKFDDLDTQIRNLEIELSGLREEQMSTLRSYLDRLIGKKIVELDHKAMTEQHKLFIQNGYRITGGKIIEEDLSQIRHVKSVRERFKEDKNAVIESFKNDPIIRQVFEQMSRTPGFENLTDEDLEQIAQILEKELAEGFEVQPQSALAQSKDSQGAALLFHETPTGSIAQVGGYKSINLPKGFRVDLGIGAQLDQGGPGAGVGAGVSKNIQLHDKVRLVIGVHGGAGISKQGPQLGASASGTVVVEAGDFDVFGGGSMTTLGPIYRIGLRKRPETYIKDARLKGEFKAGTAFLEDPIMSRAEKAERVAQMPEFESEAEKLKLFSPEVREQILLSAAERLHKEYQNSAEAKMGRFKINGIQVMTLPGVKFPIPVVICTIFGKTKLFLSTKENPSALNASSGQKLEVALKASLEKTYPGVELQFVQDPAADSEAKKLSSIGYRIDGQRILVPQSHEETHLHVNELLAGNLKQLNQKLNRIGIALSEGSGEAEGLLNLDIHGAQDYTMTQAERPRIDLRIDPSMKADIVVGNPPTAENLFLALDQLREHDLIITREEFLSPREELGAYNHTRITIKANPASTQNFNQFENQRGGLVSIESNGGVRIHKEGASKILSWKEFQAQKEELAKAGLLTSVELKAYFESDAAQTAQTLDGFIEGHESPLNTAKLEAFAREFFKTNSKEVREATLFDENINADYGKLTVSIQASWDRKHKGQVLDAQKVDFVISVLRKQTYASPKTTPHARLDYQKRNRKRFEKILSKEFGPEAAKQILADLEKSKASLKWMPARTEVFTVVSKQGARGLREDIIQDAEILNFVDYTNNAEMRMQLLSRLRTLPEKPSEFLRTSLALRTYELYGLLKGKEGKAKMDEIYKNPELAQQETHKAAFEEFQSLVKQLRAAEITGKTIVIENEFGMSLELGMRTEVYAGKLSYCDNPTIALNEKIVLRKLQGVSGAAMSRTLRSMGYSTNTAAFELMLGGSYEAKPGPGEGKPAPSGEGTGEEEEGANPGDETGGGESGGETGGEAPETGGQDLNDLD